MTTTPRIFEITSPLPTPGSTTVLEASAGTGKTWTIAALAVRLVAEGHHLLRELMLITFSRAATQELRSRIRDRFEQSLRLLDDVSNTRSEDGRQGGTSTDLDALDLLLVDGTPEELAARRLRLADALADFDAATIATTHEFCARMLDALGVLADHDDQVVVLEDLTPLVREVAADVYLQRYGGGATMPWKDLKEAVAVAQAVVQSPRDLIEPADDDRCAERVAFARAVRAEVEQRKRARRLFGYDDMLTRLDDALHDPDLGESARHRLRERYPVVLVDEFQDTDPIQWRILEAAFAGHSALVLIGDPKQAIYAFRGADVDSYLAAARSAGERWSLHRNHRSGRPLLSAFDTLMGRTQLGSPEIEVLPVEAALPEQVLLAADGTAVSPIRVRVVGGETMRRVDTVRRLVADDLVARTRELLGGGHTWTRGDRVQAVRPGDIAVLVSRNADGESLRTALTEAGIPAVLNAVWSIHGSRAAQEWSALLAAILDPRAELVRRASDTALIGWTPQRQALADEDDLAALVATVRRYGRILETDGVAALVERLMSDGLAERLLPVVGGDRLLTDLRHVAETLHRARINESLGTAALLDWLQRRGEEGAPERGRRLETDAAAVQILTYHQAKGLQYPIVLLPAGWDRFEYEDKGQVLRYHDDEGRRCLDVGGRNTRGRQDRFRRQQAEEAGEELRKFYVALTRARVHVIAWWGPVEDNTSASALHRLLYRQGSGVVPPRPPVAAGMPLKLGSQPGIVIEAVPETRRRRGGEPDPAARDSDRTDDPAAGPLTVHPFTRVLDTAWRRTSYTALTAHADHPSMGVSSEPETVRADDEPEDSEPLEPLAAAGGPGTPSPMAELPGGTAFGSLVHVLLEYADVAVADVAAELRSRAADELARLPSVGFTPEELTDALLPALETPLGPLADQRTLSSFDAADRLPELDFELPLNGPRGHAATLPAIADLLARHLSPDDLLVDYPERLRDIGERELRGFLTGSIDAVLRVGPPDRRRHLVVDYKTNRLATPGEPLTVEHYRPAAMAEAMMGSHYPLQALLYSVALHRYLRWRLPDHDPDRDLGGILYLFVRGMAGAGTPTTAGVPYGVFSWRPPTALVTDLSDLLARGVPR